MAQMDGSPSTRVRLSDWWGMNHIEMRTQGSLLSTAQDLNFRAIKLSGITRLETHFQEV